MAVLIVTVNSRAADLTIDGLHSLRDATPPICGICAVLGKTNEETAL